MTFVFPETKSCAFHYLPQCAPKFCPMEGSRLAGPCSHKQVSAQDSADRSSSTSHVYRVHKRKQTDNMHVGHFFKYKLLGSSFLFSLLSKNTLVWLFPHLPPWIFPSCSTSLTTYFPLLLSLHIFRIVRVIAKAFTWLLCLKCGQQNPTGIYCKGPLSKVCYICRACPGLIILWLFARQTSILGFLSSIS